jgi:hypothetical protein
MKAPLIDLAHRRLRFVSSCAAWALAGCGGGAVVATQDAGGSDAPADVVTVVDSGADVVEGSDTGSDVVAPVDAPPESGPGGCPAGSLSWTPSALPGLVLWLDAAKGIGATTGSLVSLWSDQSPSHNDATQSNASYQPLLLGSDIGGLPGLRFDGVRTFLAIADKPSMQWGMSDYTIAVVARFSITMGTTNQMLFQKPTVNAPWDGPSLYVRGDKPSLGTTATSQISENVYTTSAQNGLNDVPHLFTGRRFGSTIQIRVDGVVAGESNQVPAVDLSSVGQPVMIGQNGYQPSPGFEALQGDISEMVAVAGSITDADLLSLECHLVTKYGL